MDTTWILVADGVRARLLSRLPEGGSLAELQEFSHPEGRKPGRLTSRDRPPRTMESMGNARHAIEPHTTAEQKVAEQFARELADMLERGRVEHRFTQLMLVAPPRFLGFLRKALGPQLGACVVAEVRKDLTGLPASEIHSRLWPATNPQASPGVP